MKLLFGANATAADETTLRLLLAKAEAKREQWWLTDGAKDRVLGKALEAIEALRPSH